MKYMGSKNRIAKYIIPILEKAYFENECEIFIDACCGGCNLIDKINPNIPRYANDYNEYLIEMWKGLQSKKKYPLIIEKDFYSDVRDCFNGKNNKYEKDLIGWVGFMASYNGRFFDGGYSGHNVKGRDYISEQIRNTLKQLEFIKDIKFSNKSLFEIKPTKKALIYFDIPYKDTKQYSNSKKFDYELFYNYCNELKSLGNVIYVSEYEMPIDFYEVWSKELTNSMNTKKTYKPIEKLFTL